MIENFREYSVKLKKCRYGVSYTIGNGGKVFLLGADMDELIMLK